MKNIRFCIPFILFLLLSLLILGCSSDSETVSATAVTHTQQGWSAYNSGNYTQALLNFERALNSDPEYADAHNGVGWSHLSLSLTVSLALDAFRNAVRYDSSNADAWVGLANTLYLRYKDTSDFEDAIKAIDNALNADTKYLYRHDYYTNAELYALKASCYFYLGENQKAKQEIENTLQIDSGNKTAIVLQSLLKE